MVTIPKNLVRAGKTRKNSLTEARSINKSLTSRGIKRKAVVKPVSQAVIKKLTRKGFPIKKKNFGIFMVKK